MVGFCRDKTVHRGFFAKRIEVATDSRGTNRIMPGQNENSPYNTTGH